VLEKLSSSTAELEGRRSGGCQPPLPLDSPRFGKSSCSHGWPGGQQGLGPSSPCRAASPRGVRAGGLGRRSDQPILKERLRQPLTGGQPCRDAPPQNAHHQVRSGPGPLSCRDAGPISPSRCTTAALRPLQPEGPPGRPSSNWNESRLLTTVGRVPVTRRSRMVGRISQIAETSHQVQAAPAARVPAAL